MSRPDAPCPQRRSLLTSGLGWGAAASLLGGLSWLPATGAVRPSADRSVVLGVPAGAFMSHLPLLLAHELGYFRAEGLLLNWLPLESEAAGSAALSRGEVQMLVCDFAHTVADSVQGADVKAFVAPSRTPQMVFGVSPRTMAAYRQFTDLRGRRVATVLPSAASQLLIHRLMQDAGVSETELAVVNLGQPQAVVEQVRRGSMDALCVDHAMVAALEHRGEVRVVADTRTLKGANEVFGGPMPGAVVCAKSAFIQKEPEACQAVAAAVVRALKWLRTAGPSDLVRALSSVNLDVDLVNYVAALEKSRDGFMGDGVLPDAAAATALAALARKDPRLSLARRQLTATYTNDFALKAKARFRV